MEQEVALVPGLWTIIVAAGRGARFGGEEPKQYRLLAGRPLLVWSLDSFARHGDQERLLLVHPPGDGARVEALLAEHAPELAPRLVDGGATRQESVRAGLDAIAEEEGLVAVHDAARPLFDASILNRWADGLMQAGARVPVLPVADTTVETEGGRALRVLDRGRLASVQTPQLFRLSLLRAAHRSAAERGIADAGDDGGLILLHGAGLETLAGDPGNFKITGPEDLARAEAELLRRKEGRG
jgi:2-C-methyl-D-erythritol 4-phosphate cytidylyltransferase